MPNFTALELAILDRFCTTNPEIESMLREQIASAHVTKRDNSGVGFFTHFQVDRAAPLPPSCRRVLSGVDATIDDFEAPMIFLLFQADGYLDCLEGATCGDDDTTGLDLTKLRAGEIFPQLSARDA